VPVGKIHPRIALINISQRQPGPAIAPEDPAACDQAAHGGISTSTLITAHSLAGYPVLVLDKRPVSPIIKIIPVYCASIFAFPTTTSFASTFAIYAPLPSAMLTGVGMLLVLGDSVMISFIP
jgi:hypothetical protein